jgi:hypothetical protein
MRVKYFNCPSGCGSTLKVRGPSTTGAFLCPGCGKSFTLDKLQPYKVRRKDERPTVTTTQTFFTFKPKRGSLGGAIYIEDHDKQEYKKSLAMAGKCRRRE